MSSLNSGTASMCRKYFSNATGAFRTYCFGLLRISGFRRVTSEPDLLPKLLDVLKPAILQPHSPFGKQMTHRSTALRTPPAFEAFRTMHLCRLRWHRYRTELCLESS